MDWAPSLSNADTLSFFSEFKIVQEIENITKEFLHVISAMKAAKSCQENKNK